MPNPRSTAWRGGPSWLVEQLAAQNKVVGRGFCEGASKTDYPDVVGSGCRTGVREDDGFGRAGAVAGL